MRLISSHFRALSRSSSSNGPKQSTPTLESTASTRPNFSSTASELEDARPVGDVQDRQQVVAVRLFELLLRDSMPCLSTSKPATGTFDRASSVATSRPIPGPAR